MIKKIKPLNETINEFLDTIIKDLHPNFRLQLYRLLIDNPEIAKSKNKSKIYIRTLFKFPSLGSFTKQYWISRGWTEIESIYKSKEKNKSKKKVFSPFSLEFWFDKIDPKTNELYSKEGAEYKRNSQRPIRKEYWIEQGFSEEESILLAIKQKVENNNSGAKSSKNRSLEQKRSSSSRCKDYYLLRGFSEKESSDQISLKQTTFSKDICVDKYGEELGKEIWLKRQEKWQDNLKSKPNEEIEEINKKKSNSMSYNNLWSNRAIVDGKFYLLELNDNFYKIGITSRSICKRYSNTDNYKILIEFDSTINHCFQIEQLLKRHFYKNNIISKFEAIDGFGWTETLKDIDVESLKITINKLCQNKIHTAKLFKESFNLKYEENF